ncbi:MAG: hypothetical protein ACK5YH_08280 [Pseudanabaena sp.]
MIVLNQSLYIRTNEETQISEESSCILTTHISPDKHLPKKV